jgi:hypothetical protein
MGFRILKLAALVSVWVFLTGLGSPALASTIELKWDRNVEPTVTGYRVYIGSASGRYDRVVDVGNQTSFSMAGAEPGRRYYFAVAAIAGTLVSERSNEVVGVGEGASAAGPIAPDPDPTIPPGETPDPAWPYPFPNRWPYNVITRATTGGARADAIRGDVCPQSAGTCLRYAQIGPRLRDVRSISASPGGMVFVIEGERNVRLLDERQRLSDPLYSAEGSALQQVVVDPDFERTGFVFLVESIQRRDGTREANVLRFRFLNGTLGEGARVVSGVPAATGASTPLAVSPQGLLFIAVPAGTSPEGGRILMFDQMGRLVRDERSGIPVSFDGLAAPVSAWLQSDGSRLWLGGRDARGSVTVAQLGLQDGSRTAVPLEGNPAAVAGSLGVLDIPGATVIAVAQGLGASVYAVVETASGSGSPDSLIVRIDRVQ